MKGRKLPHRGGSLLGNRMILAGLVVAALAALYGLAGLSRPIALSSAAAAAPLTTEPISTALVACPGPGSGGAIGGGIATASAPLSTGAGQLTMSALGPAGGPSLGRTLRTLTTPGVQAISTIPTAAALPKALAAGQPAAGGLVSTVPGRGGVQVNAVQTMAQGLDVEQLGPDGMPTARCQTPGTDFWFVAPMSAQTHVDLYLMNPDGVPADASVGVLTDSGILTGVTPDNGIPVAPHGMVVQDLAKLLHSARTIALHITTSSGRVVAAVRETTSATAPGAWIPAAQSPSDSQVLPGLPRLTGTRELILASPSATRNAVVKVTAITSNGSYQPTGGSSINLPASSALGIPLPSLSGIPAAIKVSSTIPVTATLLISGGQSGAPGSFVVGSVPIQEQGVVAANPVGSRKDTSIVLSAPGRAASVRISYAVSGASLTGQSGHVVTIKAKSTTTVLLSALVRAKKSELVAIIVTPLPGSGPVYAACDSGNGSVVWTVLPVIPSPVQVKLPDIHQSLLSILG